MLLQNEDAAKAFNEKPSFACMLPERWIQPTISFEVAKAIYPALVSDMPFIDRPWTRDLRKHFFFNGGGQSMSKGMTAAGGSDPVKVFVESEMALAKQYSQCASSFSLLGFQAYYGRSSHDSLHASAPNS
jgi:hypothetical protein